MARTGIECVKTHRLEQVFLSVEDHIAYLTLHNPPVNMISEVMQEEILLLCDYINHDDDIWVCVMHSDLKTFCVGADINRFSQSNPGEDIISPQKVYYDGAQALYDLRVPLICAVHGHCIGGGLCYSAGADISIAVKDTLFGAPEARICVVGGSGHLSRILPPQIMRDMCYCASFITAEELHNKYGGVTVVVDTPEELMPSAEAKARELCKRGPLVLRHLKSCMNEQEDFQMHRKSELEIAYTRRMASHTDFQEGVSAFLEKRDPKYSGR